MYFNLITVLVYDIFIMLYIRFKKIPFNALFYPKLFNDLHTLD